MKRARSADGTGMAVAVRRRLACSSTATSSAFRSTPHSPCAGPSPVEIVWTVVTLGIYALNYRRSSPVGRRQTKWVMYGAYLATLIFWGTSPAAGSDAFTDAAPRWVAYSLTMAGLLFPRGLLIAMLRFDLFDIDRLLGATLSYNVLGVVVVGGGFALVPRLTASMAAHMDSIPRSAAPASRSCSPPW